MRLLAAFWLGVMAVLLVGAAYQLSPVDQQQNERLATHDTMHATVNAYLFATPDKGDDWTPIALPTQEISAAPTATPTRHEMSAQAVVTLWIRPTPAQNATGRVFRSQWLRLDTSRCIAANGAVYARVLSIDLKAADGWVAVRAGNSEYVTPAVNCGVMDNG